MDYYCFNRNFGQSFCTPKCNDYNWCINWHKKQIERIKQNDKKLHNGIGVALPSKPTK